MMNNFFNLLAIGVNGAVFSTTLSEEQRAIIAQQNQERAAWVVSLLVILFGILYFVFAHSKVKEKISEKREENKIKKAKKQNDEELDRLHKIKEKNKRK